MVLLLGFRHWWYITPKKNGEVCICVDMRAVNQAITRERHPLPTVDDLIHTLNRATVFSELDLRAGYHQVPLSPESWYITIFVTHKGLWRYTQLNFGTNSASEIFQKTIQDQLQGIPGTLNISNDVIVHGKTQAEHDRALDVVCQGKSHTKPKEMWIQQILLPSLVLYFLEMA